MSALHLLRQVALVGALLGNLTAPALAIALGVEHLRLSKKHGHVGHDGSEHQHTGPAAVQVTGAHLAFRQTPESSREHGQLHLAIDAQIKKLSHLVDAHEVAVTCPAAVAIETTHRVRFVPLKERTRLARPDPDDGPPPPLRGPPAGRAPDP